LLGAAEAIVNSGFKPRRTIRLVLFTGEEQGLLGSRAWVRDHQSEIPNLLCALVLDWGQGPITALPLAGHNELAADFKVLAEAVSGIQPLKVPEAYLTFTDAYSFTLAGLPGLGFFQESRDYSMLGHSALDTFDQVDAGILFRDSAVVALTAFWIADHPSRLGAAWPSEKTAQKLTDDGQRTLLQSLGLWPFSR
jgi:Zn-dependent M28 family amino/carboxypeptidase